MIFLKTRKKRDVEALFGLQKSSKNRLKSTFFIKKQVVVKKLFS